MRNEPVMNENMRAIEAVENKYGVVLFGMGLTHLFDVGVRNFSEENVDEAIRQINEKNEKEKADGVISVMTPDFQIAIVRCAAELSNFSIWSLFQYIKHFLAVSL